MCFRLIDAKRAQHPVSLLCDVLGVSRAGYYAWKDRPACARRRRDEVLLGEIRAIHDESKGTYGWPRVHAELRHRGVSVSRKRVARLMRAAGLSGMVRRRKGKTTLRVPGIATAPDLVCRDFAPTEPNRLWVADLTEIATWEGKLYLAVVVDCFSRRCVGWAMAEHMRAELVVEALEMALWQRRPDIGLVHHSDRGGQYVSLIFGQTARDAGIDISMGARAQRSTTPSAKASSPPSRRNSPADAPGRPAASSRARSSPGSKAGTTGVACTPPSATSRPCSSRTELSASPVLASPLRGSHTHTRS
jgi:putative transposase